MHTHLLTVLFVNGACDLHRYFTEAAATNNRFNIQITNMLYTIWVLYLIPVIAAFLTFMLANYSAPHLLLSSLVHAAVSYTLKIIFGTDNFKALMIKIKATYILYINESKYL